jgi:type IV pilus assembly protein PilF
MLFSLRRFLPAIFLVSVFAGCAHNQERANQAAFYTKLGISNLLSDNCTEALRYLLEAEKREPDNAELQNSLGIAYYCKGEYQLAVTAYEHAVRLQPDFSEAHNNLGAAYATLGNYDRAIQSFDKAISNLLYQTPERAWQNKGDAHAARFDSKQAIHAYQRAIAIAMPRAHARDVVCVSHNRLGGVHMRDKNYAEAVRELNSAIRLCPKYAEPHAQLSNAYLRLGRRADALRSCETVRVLAPDSPEAHSCAQLVEHLKGKGQ